MKFLILLVFLFYSSLSFGHTLTEKRTSDCLESPSISIASQAENLKNQGVSHQKLLQNLNPQLDPVTLETIKKIINFVYNQEHEVSASVHALTQCLNQGKK